MEPADALQTIETSLRLVIRDVLGEEWKTHISDIAKLEQKQKDDRNRRDGVQVQDDLLAFAEYHHLQAIILKDWERIKRVFDDRARTEGHLKDVADVRNDIAHSRALVPYELDNCTRAPGAFAA